MTALLKLLVLAVLAGAGYAIAHAARRGNTQVHRINQ